MVGNGDYCALRFLSRPNWPRVGSACYQGMLSLRLYDDAQEWVPKSSPQRSCASKYMSEGQFLGVTFGMYALYRLCTYSDRDVPVVILVLMNKSDGILSRSK